MWCAECEEATDVEDICRTCHKCESCCDCFCERFGESFDMDEFGEEPEDEFERRTR